MSDPTNPAGGDFRGSAADKRKDETVMVNADDLSNLVSSAREEPAAASAVPPVGPAYQPPVTTEPVKSSNAAMVVIVAVVLGFIAIFGAIMLITFLGN